MRFEAGQLQILTDTCSYILCNRLAKRSESIGILFSIDYFPQNIIDRLISKNTIDRLLSTGRILSID